MQHLIVIDMQNDFLTGSLKNDDAVAIVPFIKEKIDEAHARHQSVIYTLDTHQENYLDTLEGKYLPIKHCIEGSWGHEIVNELKPKVEDVLIEKPTFGYLDWKKIKAITDGDDIYICGTCTDICVVSNVLILKAAFPDSKVFVYKDGCAGLTKEKHEHALDVMNSCQCEVI